MLKDIISPVIYKLFNSSLLDAHFPKILKNADVTPIAKGNKVDQIDDYRPISVLSSLSKCLEMLIKVQLFEYIDDDDICP